MPDLSVVIPTYRRPAMLVEAIRSVVAGEGGHDRAILVEEDPDLRTRAIRRSGGGFVDRVALERRTGTPSPMQASRDPMPVVASLRRMYQKYVNAHGGAELLAPKLLARGVIRWT